MGAMFEVADVLKSQWPQLQGSGQYNTWKLRTLNAVRRCRTAELGSHVDGCSSCGHIGISYNSCRNRNCPKCQGSQRDKWIGAREEEILPVTYFHVVFTLPDALNRLCLYKPKILYDLLFSTAWSVLDSFGHDRKWLGAQTGMISILHTWGQTMSLHPHLHCIVPGGGLTRQGKWKTAKSEGRYLFNVKAMGDVYRGRFIAGLKEKLPQELTKELLTALYKHKWVVFAKDAFMGPQSVIAYLGRYTHKIAISNHRIQNIEEDKVSFSYKDYKHGSVKKQMTLDAAEFIRRFSLHILPKGFVRIRHYGICSNSSKDKNARVIKQQLPIASEQSFANKLTLIPYNPKQCPCCNKATMETVMRFNRGRPPPDWKEQGTAILHCIKGIEGAEKKEAI